MTFGGLSPGAPPVYRFRSWRWWCPLTLALRAQCPSPRKPDIAQSLVEFLHRCGVMAGDVVGELLSRYLELRRRLFCWTSCDETVTERSDSGGRLNGDAE